MPAEKNIPPDLAKPILQIASNDPTLTQLHFQRLKLGKQLVVLEALANALDSNTHLKVLDLSHNKIRDSGEKYIHQIIANNKSITNLDISFNYFTPCTITNITPFMRNNMNIIKIHIEEYSARGTIDMVKWVSCPHIALVRRNIVEASEQNKRLFLCRNNTTDTASFEKRKFVDIPQMIYTAHGLRELSLAENFLQEMSSPLYQLTNLRKLNLSQNRIHSIEVVHLTRLTSLTELDLENNLLSSLPFRLATLNLNNLKLNNNLLVSNLSYPHYLLENNGIHVHLHAKNSRLAPQDSIVASRVFFLGDRQSDIFKIVPLLKGIQIVHDCFKFLTNAEREVLNSAANPASRSMDVSVHDWFPVTEAEIKKEEEGDRFLGIFHRSSVHRVSEDDISSGRSRLSSRIHSMTRALSKESDSDLKPRDFRSRSLLLHPGDSGNPSGNTEPSGRLSPVHPRSPRNHNPGSLPMAPQESEHKGPGSRILANQKSSRFNTRRVETGISFRHVSCWVLDSVGLHAHQLLTAGPSNRVPIVLAFKCTLDVEQMSRQLIELIRSIDNLHNYAGSEQPSLFVVGTYKKTFDKMNRTSKKVRKQLEKIFPSLVFTFLLVCTSTGHRIKHLSEKIVEALDKNIAMETLPYPFLAAECTADWYYYFENQICTFSEAIRCIKEELEEINCERTRMARSILHWDEFTALALRYQIPKHECSKLAHFLRHLGIIHHYRDLLPQGNDDEAANIASQLIFLKPNVIFKAFSMILRSFSMIQRPMGDCHAIPAVSASSLDLVWSTFARELHESFLVILENTGQVFRTSTGQLLVPEMFNSLPEALQSLDQPPEWANQSQPDFYIARTYSFKEMSDMSFCRLVAGVHEIVSNYSPPKGKLVISQVYKYCLELTLCGSDDVTVQADASVIGRCRITYDHLRNCTALFVCEDDPQRSLFCLISEQLAQLFHSEKRYFPFTDAPVHAMCVCVKCRASDSPLAPDAWIPMDWIEDIAAEGNAFYYCGELALRIDLVAPDISLTNLQHLMVNYDDLDIKHRVGSGSFATVHYGTYKGKEVAVKQLNKGSSTSETLAEFRHEVSLMAGLQHPNTVGLQGLCTQPFCVITEFCPYGDLYSYLESRRKRELPLPIEYTMKCLADIAQGMQFLHTATPPVLHRDLKSPNILVCEIAPDEANLPEDNRFPTPKFLSPDHEASPVAVKVADFGLSMKTTGPLTERVVDNPIWLAPELLAKQPYSSASDVYAFGIIANEMFSLKLPFEDTEYTYLWQLEKKIVEGTRPSIPENVPLAMRNLIQKCWHEDPQKRPSFSIISKRIDALIEERQKGGSGHARVVPAATDMKVEMEKRKRRYSMARKISDGLLTEEELRLLLLKNDPHSALDAEAVELTPEEVAVLDALDNRQSEEEEPEPSSPRTSTENEISYSAMERPKKHRTKQKRKIASSRLHPAALKKQRSPQ